MFSRMKYFPCESHIGHDLSLVCTDKTCNESLLICPMCEHQSHQQHITLPLKLMLGQVQSVRSEDGVTLLDVALFLDRSHGECLQQINKFHEQLSNSVKQLNKKVDHYYIGLKEQLRQFSENQTPPHMILDALMAELDKSTLKSKLSELLRTYSFNSSGDAFKLNLYAGVMTACENQIQQLNDRLSEIGTESDKRMDLLMQQFKPQIVQAVVNSESPSTGSQLYTFAPSFKGANIVLSNNNCVAEQKASESNGQRFIICEPQIPKSGITKFAFKVIKYAGWIGIGVCHKDVIVTANYKFHYTNVGHGSYLISNNAYSWSHLQKDLNSSHKSFDFALNDIVIVEVDIPKKKVTWYKKKTASKFTMDIDTNLDLYPCANLCSPGDTVEILNKFD